MFFFNLFSFIFTVKYLVGYMKEKNISGRTAKLLMAVSLFVCSCAFAFLGYEFSLTQKITFDVIQRSRTDAGGIVRIHYPAYTRLPYLSAGLSQSCSLNALHQRDVAMFYGTKPFTLLVSENFPPEVDVSTLPELLPHEGQGVRMGNTYIVRLPEGRIVSKVWLHSNTGQFEGLPLKELSPNLVCNYINPKKIRIKYHYYNNCDYISCETQNEITSCHMTLSRMPQDEEESITVHF